MSVAGVNCLYILSVFTWRFDQYFAGYIKTCKPADFSVYSLFFHLHRKNKQTHFLSNTDPLNIAIETKDIEDTVSVHLDRVQSINHDHRRICVGTIFTRRRGRWSIAWPIASSSTPSHWWTHAATLIWWRSVALIIAMVTASCRTRKCEN